MSQGARTGGCLCGGVRYAITGPMRDVVACYCKQCQRTTGNFVAMTSAEQADIELLEAGTLAWYRSSDTAERGFCTRCGSNLFWRADGATSTSISGGTLDDTTGMVIAQHIYVADRAAFHAIPGDVPAFPQGGPNSPVRAEP